MLSGTRPGTAGKCWLPRRIYIVTTHHHHHHRPLFLYSHSLVCPPRYVLVAVPCGYASRPRYLPHAFACFRSPIIIVRGALVALCDLQSLQQSPPPASPPLASSPICRFPRQRPVFQSRSVSTCVPSLSPSQSQSGSSPSPRLVFARSPVPLTPCTRTSPVSTHALSPRTLGPCTGPAPMHVQFPHMPRPAHSCSPCTPVSHVRPAYVSSSPSPRLCAHLVPAHVPPHTCPAPTQVLASRVPNPRARPIMRTSSLHVRRAPRMRRPGACPAHVSPLLVLRLRTRPVLARAQFPQTPSPHTRPVPTRAQSALCPSSPRARPVSVHAIPHAHPVC